MRRDRWIGKWGLALAALGAALALGWGSAAAQTVMEKAKKEGKVVWYSSLSRDIAQEVCDLFNKKKVGFQCELFRDGSGKLYQRYLQEARANIYVADVLHTSNVGHFIALKKRGALAKYTPKETEGFPKSFRDADGTYFVLRASLYAPAFNPTKINPAEAPRSWKDFLNPKWTGKVVSAHPSYSGIIMTGVAALVELYGWKYYEDLAKLKPRIVQSAVQTSEYVVSGEAPLALNGAEYNHFNHMKKGDPIRILFMEEGMPIVTSPNAVLAKAPHPNAARVFTDFLFSQEAQQLLVNRGLYVGRSDVKYPEGKKSLQEIKILDVDDEKLSKQRQEIEKRFRQIFGV